MAPLPKLMWFREHEPETFARGRALGRDQGARARSGSRATWAIDHSFASATGLMALDDLDWDAEALELAGIAADQLARLVPATERSTLTDGGRAADRPRPPAAGRRGRRRRAAGEPRRRRRPPRRRRVLDRHQRRAAGDGRAPGGRPASGGSSATPSLPGAGSSAARSTTAASCCSGPRDALAPDLGDDAAEEARSSSRPRRPPGSAGLIMLPYLLCERAPHWSPLPRGAYIGLTRAHRREHLVRAALEGVCQQLALVLASMRDAGNEVREIRATGGFARSALWRQILADALGHADRLPRAATRAPASARRCSGWRRSGSSRASSVAADLVRIEDVVEPDRRRGGDLRARCARRSPASTTRSSRRSARCRRSLSTSRRPIPTARRSS